MTEKSKFFTKARKVSAESADGFSLPEIDPIIAMAMFAVVCGVIISLVFVWWRTRTKPEWIVVDGSNVLYWDGQIPSLRTVRLVLNCLLEVGYCPIVFFDANVGYRVGTRYFSAYDLAGHLPVPETQIVVADKGSPADPLLIAKARTMKSRVVTNDRFRDWFSEYPETQKETFYVRGQVNHGNVKFEFEG